SGAGRTGLQPRPGADGTAYRHALVDGDRLRGDGCASGRANRGRGSCRTGGALRLDPGAGGRRARARRSRGASVQGSGGGRARVPVGGGRVSALEVAASIEPAVSGDAV